MKKIISNLMVVFIVVLSLSSCAQSIHQSATEKAADAMAKSSGNQELDDILNKDRAQYDLYMNVYGPGEGESAALFANKLIDSGVGIDCLWANWEKTEGLLIALAVKKDKTSAQFFIAANNTFVVFKSSAITYPNPLSFTGSDGVGSVNITGQAVPDSEAQLASVIIDGSCPFISGGLKLLDSKK